VNLGASLVRSPARSVTICMLAAAVCAAPVAASGSASDSKRWTEFGATERAWRSAHVLDPTDLSGCCFLPRVRPGFDRYSGVTFQTFGGVSRVVSFTMYFMPGISLARARAVVRREAPPDATLAFLVTRPTCLQIAYRSKALLRALRSKQAVMFAQLSSPPPDQFNGRTIGRIIFLPTGNRSTRCGTGG
jgi:hypothetical protein